jgi:AraC-like DNA-binding protein
VSGGQSVEEVPMEVFRQVMETNFFGALRCIKAVLPTMRENHQGCIVNVTSVSGRIALASQAPYAASKWAFEALSECLAQEMKAFNVRVAIVEPGVIATPIFSKTGPARKDSPYPHLRRLEALFSASLTNRPRVCSSTLFGMPMKVTDQRGPRPSAPFRVSRHADRLFARIRGVIKDGFADPDFGPRQVAAEAAISLPYLQKLFTARGSTCSEFIYSLRLNHAAHLLHRRASLGTSQPLSEIAFACGFRDYTHFARKFRHRFGYSPGGHGEGDARARDAIVRAGTGESASRAHDTQPRET